MIRGAFQAPLLAICLAAAINGFGPGLAYGQESVTLRGQVVNGTEGAPVAEGLAVFLHSFSQGTDAVSSTETVTDASGGFQFDDVTSTGDLGYAITMDYAGMRYSTLLGKEDLAGTVELRVYESTQDLSVVQIERQALVITAVDQKEQRIEAVEFVSLSNVSDRTLLPDLSNVTQGQFSFLRFSLPPRTADFDIQSNLVGGEVIPVGTGFALTAPIVPGGHTLSFTFTFPYEGGTFSYGQNLLQGAKIYQVLIPEGLTPIAAVGLSAMPSIDVDGAIYRLWEGQGFAPGQGLTVQLINLPQPSLLSRWGQSVTGVGFWRIAIPGTLGTALAVLLVYAGFLSPRVAALSTGPSLAQPNGDGAHRDALIRAVALLDERFQQGQVPEADYQDQREQLKDRILETTTSTGGETDRE